MHSWFQTLRRPAIVALAGLTLTVCGGKDSRSPSQPSVPVLVAKGYCGLFDGEEIEVKRTNDFSEHYSVNYADRYIRTGTGIFRGSCYPAAF